MSEPITSLVSRSDGRAVGSLGAAGHRVAFHTAGELWDRGKDDMPSDLVASEHLIYSSPAALSFNSPGAEGFGVKRAGLSIPGSVMLIVSPGCCGRNTSSISSLPGYEGRFFYLTMGETDLVTGRHLDRIPKVVAAVCAGLAQPPSVVMVCITCVDALLGTDMERVCRRAEALAGVRVRPCYMYALTREGRRPPMVHVRQSLYSLLEPRRRDPRSCNLLGFFAPVERDSDLRVLLRQAGLRHVREISTSADYDDFQRMASANFNLVLNPEARAAAQDLRERLGTPYIELARLYQVDRIRRQYDALASALGVRFDQAAFEAEAQQSARSFVARHGGEVFAVGECANADPFELAVALVRAGLGVAEIFGTLSPERYVYLRHLAALSPDTRIYSNLGPSMIHYDPGGSGVTVTIGRDAGSYHPSCPNLAWSDEGQPFGYRAVSGLFSALDGLLSGGGRGRGSALSLADEHRAAMSRPAGEGACDLVQLPSGCAVLPPAHEVRGLRRALTPFAPDQSGAIAVLYGLGGMSVVVDAGGCTGNICGFDEPRWFEGRDAVFSAGLRDMDAILGRDDLLVEKLADAAAQAGASFATLVGTPVPAVIGTDLHAVARMVERRVGLPCLAVETDGMALYDKGAEKAYRALLEAFAGRDAGGGDDPAAAEVEPGLIGVLGATPLDLTDPTTGERLAAHLRGQGWRRVVCFGMGACLDDVRAAGRAERNLVVAPAGLAAAWWLQRRFGTPFDVDFPLADRLLPAVDWTGRRVLVVHQQVMADALRRRLLGHGAASVTTATFFCQPSEATREGDHSLREEGDVARAVASMGADVILADRVLRPLVPDFSGDFFDMPHFALSGSLCSLWGGE